VCRARRGHGDRDIGATVRAQHGPGGQWYRPRAQRVANCQLPSGIAHCTSHRPVRSPQTTSPACMRTWQFIIIEQSTEHPSPHCTRQS
jgi:hypothetical protein